jgi:hypothetical protein
MTMKHLRSCSRTAIAALVASAAVGAVPAPAQPLPIVITSCTMLQAPPSTTRFWYPFGPTLEINAPVVDGVRIVYTNKGPVAANRVAFFVDYRGDKQRVIDAGTFAPNVAIDHTFGAFSGDAYLGPKPDACTAVAVRYADGTTWRVLP